MRDIYWTQMKPFICILCAIMFSCDSRLPSFASRGVPLRGSGNQITAGSHPALPFRRPAYSTPLNTLLLVLGRTFLCDFLHPKGQVGGAEKMGSGSSRFR